MFINSAFGSMVRSALLAVSLLAAAPVFAAEPTIDQVYQAASSGHFDDAQAMMDKVLQAHPNSAKAHYVEADLLAKQDRLAEARTELNTALRIDPSEKFAKPQALAELKSTIAQPHRVIETSRSVYSQPVYTHAPMERHEGGSGMLTVIVIIFLVLLFFGIVRMLTRRATVVNTYGGGYAGGGVPGYGPGYGGGPGYGPGGVVVNQGGMGSGILGGLATGAAVGAGIVAGEELMHHMTDRDDRRDYNDAPRQSSWSDDNGSSNSSQNYDMGGNDFGVSDSSSWDSGGGGGSDDWN
jgi:hypothetical protein